MNNEITIEELKKAMETELGDKDLRVGYKLLDIIKKSIKTVTYGTMSLETNISISEIKIYLGHLSTVSYALGLPFISGRVVNKEEGQSGPGYFKMLINEFEIKDDIQVMREMEKAQEHQDYSKLEKYLHFIEIYNKLKANQVNI